MFVLRVSSEEMCMLKVFFDYYLSDFSHLDFYDLKDKVLGSEYYDDDLFHIVLKDIVKEDPE